MVAATALQSVAEAFERAMKNEEFDRAAELKTKALELRRAQERRLTLLVLRNWND